ncbi:DUF1064 domain-containing protein [Paenibacillus agaridevorans]|uniref:DUF1064 domain-containing protein n=1 Tax=Paenibacillus agaridevorans TaxID=171404 RepID=UPI001BE3E7CB|nr:DUF1064 domain-containing protein [Paenibacillus agaridevorans]
MSKYGSRKTTIDGVTFHSAAEARYYQQLKLRKLAGDITDFELQPVFVLLEPFRKNGKKYAGIKYKADFRIKHLNGSVEIVDVKGFETTVYRMKKMLFENKFPDLTLTEVSA